MSRGGGAVSQRCAGALQMCALLEEPLQPDCTNNIQDISECPRALVPVLLLVVIVVLWDPSSPL